MYFQMISRDGELVLIHETWIDAYLDLGFAFFLSPGK